MSDVIDNLSIEVISSNESINVNDNNAAISFGKFIIEESDNNALITLN